MEYESGEKYKYEYKYKENANVRQKIFVNCVKSSHHKKMDGKSTVAK